MVGLREQIARAARANATVFVTGERGTGKELVARAIHLSSKRAKGAMEKMNCAAVPSELIESEMFGHEAGAFTGATKQRRGKFERASGGTLFLDEVGDMPLATQAKLLRVLETREVQPVGGNQLQKVDIRLIAATNRDLRTMVRDRTFREDLLYRLQVVTVELPPLRDRKGDIPLLVDHFVSEFAAQHGRAVRGIAPEARTALLRYDWPGNVRELRNTIESMVLLARGGILLLEDVPDSVRAEDAGGTTRGGAFDLAGRSLAEVERELIRENLKVLGGNREKTAKVLGIGERTLYRKIREYGL